MCPALNGNSHPSVVGFLSRRSLSTPASSRAEQLSGSVALNTSVTKLAALSQCEKYRCVTTKKVSFRGRDDCENILLFALTWRVACQRAGELASS